LNGSGQGRAASEQGTATPDPDRSPPVATRSTNTATALVLASAACFGSVVIFTELAKRAGASLATTLAGRYLTGAVLLLALGGGTSALARLPRRRVAALVLAGGGGQSTIAFLTLKALDYVPAATVAFLFYTYPSWVAIFAVARGSEPVARTRAAALALSLAGIVLMVGSPWEGGLEPRGVALALGGALAYALYIPLLQRLQEGVGAVPAATLLVAATGVIFTAVGLLTGTLAVRLAPAAWLWIAALAVICTAVAFITFLRGLAVLGPVRTAIVSTVEPFWTLLLAVPALGQPLRPATAAGGALIATAVLLLQRRRG
jgi:drug/metabolite transporter (DMT)-like permease